MESSPVIKKFLAVIRGERENAVIPESHLPKCANHALDLMIHPANAAIVQAHDLVAIPAEAYDRKTPSIPIRVQVASAGRRNGIIPNKALRLLLRVVRTVRIHEVQPQEKWLPLGVAEPSARLVSNQVCRGIAAKRIHRIRHRGDTLTIPKIDFLIEGAPQTLFATSVLQQEIQSAPASACRCGRMFFFNTILTKEVLELVKSTLVPESRRDVGVPRAK